LRSLHTDRKDFPVRSLSSIAVYLSLDAISYFFLSSFGAHRDLHSFPTRRSSDLSSFSDIGVIAVREDVNLEAAFWAQFPGNFRRSEEHTSELQSRRELVCRLLLEKKKPRSNKLAPKHIHRLHGRSNLSYDAMGGK